MPTPAAIGAWAPRCTLAAILVGTALLRVRLLAIPLERDEGEYAYMGQLILRGEVPYVAAYNMKLPGTYYATAAIFGLLGQTDVGLRLGLLVVNLASIVVLYHLGRKLLDATVGLGAAAAYALLALSPSVLGFAAKAEHFVILPMLAGVLLLVDPGRQRRLIRIVGAGLLLGLAVLMKQQAAAFVAFGALVLLAPTDGGMRFRAPRAVAECALFGIAALLPFALTCLAMYVAGAFSSFWFWTVSYASTYAVMVPFTPGVRHLGRQIFDITTASPALWLLAVLGAAALWWDAAARRRARFLALFAITSLVAICPGWRFSEHYFLLLLPATSLLVGVAIGALGGVAEARRPRLAPLARWGVALLAVGLSLAQERAYLFQLSPAAISRLVYGANPFPEAVEIARYIRERSASTDRIAVIGSEPEFYFYSRRQAATAYIYMYPLMEAHGFSEQLQRDMIAQIDRVQPRFLVLVNVDTSWTMQPDSSHLLLDWAAKTVDQDYEPVASADIVPGEATVYRWDADAAAQPRSRFYVVLFRRREPGASAG